jgi:hypothetical protein
MANISTTGSVKPLTSQVRTRQSTKKIMNQWRLYMGSVHVREFPVCRDEDSFRYSPMCCKMHVIIGQYITHRIGIVPVPRTLGIYFPSKLPTTPNMYDCIFEFHTCHFCFSTYFFGFFLLEEFELSGTLSLNMFGSPELISIASISCLHLDLSSVHTPSKHSLRHLNVPLWHQ